VIIIAASADRTGWLGRERRIIEDPVGIEQLIMPMLAHCVCLPQARRRGVHELPKELDIDYVSNAAAAISPDPKAHSMAGASLTATDESSATAV
jgi:hypothetical protein